LNLSYTDAQREPGQARERWSNFTNFELENQIMSVSSKIGIVVFASAAAFTAAAPSAFAADSGKWVGNFYVASAGVPDAPAATYSRQVMDKGVAAGNAPAAGGSWNKDFYTAANGTPDAPAATYSRQVVQRKVATSESSTLASKSWIPAY